ncbi:NAD(P)-dependent oxidoreductase [Rhizobium sp. Root1204]|uniref:NAD(P)-dependent oxidoreductase n=1 Tax=Rhizobium sp. Root1204 TaxID=1736428 RepID=UPI000715F890|nr:NAD(P)-dependent oxidoreductase [Rhizobium sp. Root1204]KQV41311.1 3-beta hydroxysteroid dehydrogenase [Rhizobium sp. Root1204]
MKIAVIGAAGNAGRRIVQEAVKRGHEVTAIGPTLEKLTELGAASAVVGDVTKPEELAGKLAGHDVIVSSARFVRYEPVDLLTAAKTSGVPRLVVVGGAGSLRSAAGGLVAEGPNFPEAAKSEAAAGMKLLEQLRKENELDWTFLSPSAVFSAGERTGKFRLGEDELLVSAEGKSHISFEDYAIALLDEIENPRNSRKRFTVGY